MTFCCPDHTLRSIFIFVFSLHKLNLDFGKVCSRTEFATSARYSKVKMVVLMNTRMLAPM